jgi:hypothetical protein
MTRGESEVYVRTDGRTFRAKAASSTTNDRAPATALEPPGARAHGRIVRRNQVSDLARPVRSIYTLGGRRRLGANIRAIKVFVETELSKPVRFADEGVGDQ